MTTTEGPAIPDALVSSAKRFDEAGAAVVDYLKRAVPLGFWAVTRYDGERQVYLQVADDVFGARPGDSHDWDAGLCKRMVDGAPRVAPDAMAVPEYAESGMASVVPIGTYVGIPIQSSTGQLFGTICGIDPQPRDAGLAEQAPLLHLLGSLLTTILQADLERVTSQRTAERAALEAETDALTGLANRRGWARFLQQEEERFRAFGDPATVIMIDLDGLKRVNDERGHPAGDELIRRAADVLSGQVRGHDLVARLGGDEFGVVATRLVPSQAEPLVARLRAALHAAGVSASFGSSPYSLAEGFAAAVERADSEMYADKARRRGSSAR